MTKCKRTNLECIYCYTGDCEHRETDGIRIDDNEKCRNCVHCKELYFPPTLYKKAVYSNCCTLFIGEGSVMYLSDTESMCECFKEVGEPND